MICGQEMGTEKKHIQHGAVGRYDPDKILMVGNAPSDMKAARRSAACFYPMSPGDEATSRRRLHAEADRFFAGECRGEYEERLIADLVARLPSRAPWKKGTS